MILDGDNLVLAADDPPVQHVVIDQDGYIGLNDTTPTASLSVSGNIVMLNQSGIYFNEVGNISDYPALIVTQNKNSDTFIGRYTDFEP